LRDKERTLDVGIENIVEVLGDTSCRRWVVLTPELLTRMSIEPTSVSACATAALMEVMIGDVQLDHMGVAALAVNGARSSLSFSTRRLASTTAAPAAARVRANCAPRPLDAPVTKPHAARQINAVGHLENLHE
jgi:hypothetical protein